MNEPDRRQGADGDDALGRRLADALGTEADRVQPPAGAWDRFQARVVDEGMGVVSDAGRALPPAARPAAAPSPPRRGTATRWRIPLVAAAAVAVIAVATAAIVTRGSGGAGHPAAGGSGASSADAATGATVPIGDSGEAIVAGGGAAVVSGAGIVTFAGGPSMAASQGPSQAPSTSARRPTKDQDPGTAASVAMSFVAGRPPTAILRGTFTFPGGATAPAGGRASDGTPLGYLSMSSDPDGHRYLWGAVGPNVEQVDIGTVQPPSSGDIDPGFHSGPNWVVDSGKGTAWSLPEAATTVWTGLGGGWHGFAVRIPGDVTSVSVLALNPDGRITQARAFDPATGHPTDEQVPQTTRAPQWSSSGGGPEQSASASADEGCARMSRDRNELTVNAGPDAAQIHVRLDASGTLLCVDDGTNLYAIEPINGPPDQVMRFFGVTSTERSGDSTASYRLVIGAVGPTATHLTATTGITQIGQLHPLPGTDLRVFVMRTGPGTGTVTAADDSEHEVIQSVNRVADASGSAEPSQHR